MCEGEGVLCTQFVDAHILWFVWLNLVSGRTYQTRRKACSVSLRVGCNVVARCCGVKFWTGFARRRWGPNPSCHAGQFGISHLQCRQHPIHVHTSDKEGQDLQGKLNADPNTFKKHPQESGTDFTNLFARVFHKI